MALLPTKILAALARMRLHLPRVLHAAGQGDRRSTRRGSSVEFSDYREYEPGDDYRHIDWNLYGRLDRLFVRLFAEEQNQNIHVLVDRSASMQVGSPSKLEYGRAVAAAVSYVALWSGDETRLGAVGEALDWYTPRLGGRHRAHALFSSVERIEASGGTDIKATLTSLAAAKTRADATILISDLLDPGWEEALGRLGAQSGTSVLIHLLAESDWTPDFDGECELEDAETGELLLLTLDAPAVQHFQQGAADWCESVRARCRQSGVLCYQLDTSLPLGEFLLTNLRRGGLFV